MSDSIKGFWFSGNRNCCCSSACGSNTWCHKQEIRRAERHAIKRENTSLISLNQAGQVVSRSLAQNDAMNMTLFSFDKGEEISTHESGGDAFVTCLDGVGEITIDGVKYELHEGESIVMPAKHPHAVYGKEQFKMLLVVVF